MSTHRRRANSTPARLLWGGATLLVLLALVGSVLLSRSALRNEEQTAQARAAAYVHDVLFNALTPHLVSEPILGPNYRELIITVQAGILSDERVARIRVWKTDGTLIFSTDQRDQIGEFVAQDSPQIGAAADGTTVSLVTEARVAPKSGLAGADEELYETFVPLRLLNELGVSGVVQIDQRFAAIRSAADRVWRPVQIGLGSALLAAIVLLVRSFLRPVAETAAEALRGVRASAVPGQAAGAPSELKAAEARAEKAERAHREIQARLDAELSAKATMAATAGASSPASRTTAELEAKLHDAEIELHAKLGAAEAEREHLSGEVQRLRAALSEREGELAIAREGAPKGQADSDRTAELSRTAEQRIAEFDQRSHAAEQRAVVAEQRVSEIEAELRLAAAARGSLEAAAKKTATDGETRAGAELRQARLQLNELLSKLAEAGTALQDATAAGVQKDASLGELRIQHDRVTSDLESVRSNLLKREAELKALQQTMAAKDGEVAGKETEIEAKQAAVDAAVAELSSKGASMQKELEASRAAIAKAETGRKEAEAAIAKAETGRKEAEAAKAAADAERVAAAKRAGESERSIAKVADLEGRFAELEARRRSEVSDLQRAQEALANTQVEATQATKRAKEAEARVRELEEAAREAAQALPATYEVAEEFRQPSITSRLAALHREPAPEAESAGEGEAAPDEGLSLRERLTRAAAARHRPSGTGES